jgi:DNA polymerase-3 subunit gamma/tau
MIERQREPVLYARVINFVHLVHFEPGRLEFRPAPGAPRELASDLARILQDWTGSRWVVSVSQDAGAPTLAEAAAAKATERKESAEQDPSVQAVLERFPGAEVIAVRNLAPEAENSADDPTEPIDEDAQ